ncbi:MAG TPA: alpha/beta fold hydrolase [Solirubrobacterales bacterium]|nr:alpha/beta fold hydrolase [Solirubrobacterales bacterium]
MPGTRRSPVSRLSRRAVLALAAAALVVIVAIAAALSWHFSSVVLVPDHSPWSEQVEIEAVARDRIVLERSEAAERAGRYGLAWEAGHAIVGPVLEADDATVTRRLSEVRGYLAPGTDAGFDSDVYAGDPRQALGLPFRDVTVSGELGPMPAWLVPPRDAEQRRRAAGAWAILVHGINGDPQVGLRILPPLRRLGFASLLVTYRDDLGAPSSPDGLHHLGQTEWRDLEAAVRFALRRGARQVVLVGYSMGGSLVSQLMQRSRLADRVDALVLDAPALDWRSILAFNSTEEGWPAVASLPLRWAIDLRIDADWDSLDAAEHPEAFHLPILLFHGAEDEVVPIEDSEEFAAELQRWVTYYAVPEAGHVQAWNVDPALYERHLIHFLNDAFGHSPARHMGS